MLTKVQVQVKINPLCLLLSCLFCVYMWDWKVGVARQIIIFIAILTGGDLGGCKPLIKAIVNDAESAVEIKPLLFPFP